MDARVEEVVAAKSKEAEAMLDEVKRTSAEDLAKVHDFLKAYPPFLYMLK